MQKLFSKISTECRIGFISAFIWGIIAHGMALFNKFSFNDDIQLFYIGSTYQSGRWMLGIINDFHLKLFGWATYSMPLLNGLFSIMFIAIVVVIFIDLYNIKNKILCVAISGLLVVFPVITSLFGYMFTAPSYMFGLAIGVGGVWILCSYKRWYTYVIGILLCACCVGVYQAYIPVLISAIVIYMIKINVESDKEKIADYFKEALYYIFACIGFLLTYIGINNFFLISYNQELLGYRGLNTLGATSLSGYVHRVILAYKEFFLPTLNNRIDMYPMGVLRFYKLLLLAIIFFSVILLVRLIRKDILKSIYVFVLMICIPLATNFIYVMCDIAEIHTLMVYGKVMLFVYVLWLANKCLEDKILCVQSVSKITILVILIVNIMYCRFDNACYLKAEFVQQQTISYYTMLSTQIKNCEGYRDELPVVFINWPGINDSSIKTADAFRDIKIIPYGDTSELIGNYAWQRFMEYWCGYCPTVLDAAPYQENEEVLAMPSYPDDGSIKIIDGVIVIKF